MTSSSEKEQPVSQRLMTQIERLYASDNDDEDETVTGLCSIGDQLGIPVSRIYRKCTVLVIGNVSAGKSTFINWYVKEHLQKTGVAIETSGFTFISSGPSINELKGESTVMLVPWMKELCNTFPGLLDNLTCKTTPSPKLRLMDLVDSPGLADGDLTYPFDVEGVILSMADHVDMICVFFDPIGQALGRRIMNVVQMLNQAHPEKIRYCLSKVDDIPSEEERIKVICQTTQSLTAKISVKHGFDLLPIFIPGAKDGSYLSLDTINANDKRLEDITVNRIRDLVADTHRCVEAKVQDSLASLKKDCDKLAHALNKALSEDKVHRAKNKSQATSIASLVFTTLIVGLALLIFVVADDKWRKGNFSNAPIHMVALAKLSMLIRSFVNLSVVNEANKAVPQLISGLFYSFLTLVLATFVHMVLRSKEPVFDHRDLKAALEQREFVKSSCKKWKALHNEYLHHATSLSPRKRNSSSSRSPKHASAKP